MIRRRGFIAGLGALLAAPAVVRAGSLMPVRVMPDPESMMTLAQWSVRYPVDIREVVNLLVRTNDVLADMPFRPFDPPSRKLVQWGSVSTTHIPNWFAEA